MVNNFKSKIGLITLDLLKNFRVRYYLKIYLESIKWSKDEIQHYQIMKLRELLRYSYHNVPFYKKRFDDSNFNYERFRYFDQLKNIPPLTRNDLQTNEKNLLSSEKSKFNIYRSMSSGSTAKPVKFYHDQFGKSSNKAAVLVSKILGGYKIGDPWINIWGFPTTGINDWEKFSSKISKFLFNEARFPAYQLNKKENFEKLFSLFQKKMPKFVYGYTNAIYLFSRFLEENSLQLDSEINGVFCTAENLHDFQRATIEKHLGKVYDHYGCREINGIAAQTIYDDNYAIIDPHVYLEFNSMKHNDNNLYTVLVTHLHNKVFPLIRYENGDLAKPLPTPDYNKKLNFSKIYSIEGRVSDIVKLPQGGHLVVPSFLGSTILKDIEGVKQYQVVQTSPYELKVNLITDKTFNRSNIRIINESISNYLQDAINYKLVFNEPIIKSQNGKFKLLIKKI